VEFLFSVTVDLFWWKYWRHHHDVFLLFSLCCPGAISDEAWKMKTSTQS